MKTVLCYANHQTTRLTSLKVNGRGPTEATKTFLLMYLSWKLNFWDISYIEALDLK